MKVRQPFAVAQYMTHPQKVGVPNKINRSKDHYHRFNPDRTSKANDYLDKAGNPTPRGSDQFYLMPRGTK